VLRYVGASQVNDTPEGSKVQLTLSGSFDVTAEHRIVSSKRVGKLQEVTVEVKLKNAKPRSVTVRAVQPMPGLRGLLSESAKGVVIGGSRQWTVEVPSKGEQTLRYTVRVGY
jgi:hypothetical protein